LITWAKTENLMFEGLHETRALQCGIW